jgi:hypothetical protein
MKALIPICITAQCHWWVSCKTCIMGGRPDEFFSFSVWQGVGGRGLRGACKNYYDGNMYLGYLLRGIQPSCKPVQ